MTAALKLTSADWLAIEREYCERHLVNFVRQAWSVLEPSTNYVHNWHVGAICEHLEAVTAGEITRLLINVPPGPMRADSIVETGRGQVRLDHVQVGDVVLTHRGRYRRVSAVHRQGVLPILKIVTHSGRKTFAAPSHPYLTPKGWIEAGHLAPGDILAVVNKSEDRPCPSIISAEESRFLGYIVGDGSVTHSPGFVNCDREVIDDFVRCAKALGFKTSERRQRTFWKVGISGARPMLEKHGLLGKNSYTKRAPAAVMNGDCDSISNFLGAYWSCDGGIDVRPTRSRGSRFRAYATTVSEGLAFDLVDLLAAVGVDGRLRRKCRKLETAAQPGGLYRSFSVEVQSEAMAGRVVVLPGLCSSKRAQGEGCRADFEKTLWSDPIVSIEAQEPAECLCLTVEDDHSFTCSGIAVKNTMKSLLCGVFWPAWEWANNPSLRIVSASYSETYALRDARRMRQLITSEWYQALWPLALAADQNATGKFENSKLGFRHAMPVKSMTGSRGDRVLWDDPHSVEGANSPADITTTGRVFHETLPTRLNSPEHSAIVIIMQRLNQRDVSGLALEDGMGYDHLCLPMEYEPDHPHPSTRYTDPRTEPGELLFPERFPRRVVERDKIPLGAYAVSGQFQQRPAPRGGGLFPVDNFVIDDHAPAPTQIDKSVRYWDKAGTDGGGDWTAGVLMHRMKDGRFVIEHCVRKQLGALKREQKIKATAETDGYGPAVWVEQEGGSGGKESAERTVAMLAGWKAYHERVTGDKQTRAEGYAAQVQGGNVSLVRGDWNRAFIDEHEVFPAGAHDDQVDAASGAFNKLAARPKRRAGAL